MNIQHKIGPSTVLAKRQTGAVLIVSLMLLLVMTLLSIASMNTSVCRKKMAANSQNSNRTFQAAESAVYAMVSTVLGGNSDELNTAMTAVSGQGTLINVNIGTSDATSTAQVEYLGEIIATGGSSINADESSTLLSGYRFELVGTGSIDAVQAQTQIRQGIEYH